MVFAFFCFFLLRWSQSMLSQAEPALPIVSCLMGHKLGLLQICISTACWCLLPSICSGGDFLGAFDKTQRCGVPELMAQCSSGLCPGRSVRCKAMMIDT